MKILVLLFLFLTTTVIADPISYIIQYPGVYNLDSGAYWEGNFWSSSPTTGFLFYVGNDKPVTGNIFGMSIVGSAAVGYGVTKPTSTPKIAYVSVIPIDIGYLPHWETPRPYSPPTHTGIPAHVDKSERSSFWWPNYFSTEVNTHFDYGVRDYKQTSKDYVGYQYSNVAGTTFAAKACWLVSACDTLGRIGIETDPLTLNAWLRINNGYSGKEVNGAAIVAFARKMCDQNIKYTMGGDLNISLQKGRATFTSVKNAGHWVAVTGFNKPSATRIRHRIHDPNGVKNYSFLEDYRNYSFSNIRAYYYPEQSSNPRILSGASSIEAHSTSPIQLLYNGQPAASSIPQFETSDDGDGIPNGEALSFGDAQPGNYSLIITASGPYSVTLYRSDMNGESTLTTCEGIGPATIPITHSTPVEMDGVAENIWTLPINNDIKISNVVITARLSPTEVMAQSPAYRIPAIRIQTTVGNVGDIISGTGTVQNKYLNLVNTAITGTGTVEPFAVSIDSLPSTNGVFVKIVGTVTSIIPTGFILNNIINVIANSQSIGDVVVVTGVYYNGVFYSS